MFSNLLSRIPRKQTYTGKNKDVKQWEVDGGSINQQMEQTLLKEKKIKRTLNKPNSNLPHFLDTWSRPALWWPTGCP